MLFNSTIFVAFLAWVLGLYYLLPDRWKTGFLLVMSYVFYGYWDPKLLSLIWLSTAVDFVCGRAIHASGDDERRRKFFLWVSMAVNLGMLGLFK